MFFFRTKEPIASNLVCKIWDSNITKIILRLNHGVTLISFTARGDFDLFHRISFTARGDFDLFTGRSNMVP